MKSLLALFAILVSASVALAEHDESPLHNEMEAMNRSFRQLKRQYTDAAQKASSLELVSAMQQHAETARTLTPPKAGQLSSDDQAKYVASFQQHLDGLIKEIGALKAAVADGKADVAAAEIKKIGQLKDAGHDAMKLGKGKKRSGPAQGS